MSVSPLHYYCINYIICHPDLYAEHLSTLPKEVQIKIHEQRILNNWMWKMVSPQESGDLEVRIPAIRREDSMENTLPFGDEAEESGKYSVCLVTKRFSDFNTLCSSECVSEAQFVVPDCATMNYEPKDLYKVIACVKKYSPIQMCLRTDAPSKARSLQFRLNGSRDCVDVLLPTLRDQCVTIKTARFDPDIPYFICYYINKLSELKAFGNFESFYSEAVHEYITEAETIRKTAEGISEDVLDSQLFKALFRCERLI